MELVQRGGVSHDQRLGCCFQPDARVRDGEREREWGGGGLKRRSTLTPIARRRNNKQPLTMPVTSPPPSTSERVSCSATEGRERGDGEAAGNKVSNGKGEEGGDVGRGRLKIDQ